MGTAADKGSYEAVQIPGDQIAVRKTDAVLNDPFDQHFIKQALDLRVVGLLSAESLRV